MTYSSLSLKNLELAVTLGWPDQERLKQQLIYLDIYLKFKKIPNACKTDHLDDTLCYNQLTEIIRLNLIEKNFHLLEHISETIYQIIKSNVNESTLVAISVTKYPDIPGLKNGVSFQIGDMELT